MHSVLNKLLEYTYFYMSKKKKNITSYAFLLVYKNLPKIFSESLRYGYKNLFVPEFSNNFSKIHSLSSKNYVRPKYGTDGLPSKIWHGRTIRPTTAAQISRIFYLLHCVKSV